jgi:prepilin-type N-terminal cleavage/methylation domain-containing protein
LSGGLLGRLYQRVHDERGFTLIELVVSMAILGTVLGGISTALASGTKSEARLQKRFQALNDVTVAMSTLKREVHKACQLNSNPNTVVANTGVVVIDLPPGDCSTTLTTVTWCVSAGTLKRIVGNSATCTGGTVYARNITTATPFTYTPCNYPANSYTLARLSIDISAKVSAGAATDTFRWTDTFAFRNSARSAAPTC